jgi:hypothetical protein
MLLEAEKPLLKALLGLVLKAARPLLKAARLLLKAALQSRKGLKQVLMFASTLTVFTLPMGCYGEAQDMSSQVGHFAEEIDRGFRASPLQ